MNRSDLSTINFNDIYVDYDWAAKQPERYEAAINIFEDNFGTAGDFEIYSAPGRTEIGGNHTDHQHGEVLAASINRDAIAITRKTSANLVRVISGKYKMIKIDSGDLQCRADEEGTTEALIRGMLQALSQDGYEVGGFDAYITSDVLIGAGLSSSAAFETLIGTIISGLYNDMKIDPVTIAKAGQYAENVYFGKPCGLMDQMGSAVGGAVAIDFADPANPIVARPGYDFDASGHALCIIDTGSSHDDLTDDYAAVAAEMRAVAAVFGKTVLREVPEELFRENIASVREQCGDRAVLRARHFYSDDRRAAQEADALREGDFDRFLALVNESGLSSVCDLQNIWSPAHPARQSVSLALSIGRELLGGRGAIRVHGGGFAGTVQAFVPEDLLTDFRDGIEAVFGEGKCHILRIRPLGGTAID